MRRTTICRSEHRAALLALVAGLLAGRAPALAAQDTTHARPDTSQRAPDTSQAAPAPVSGLQGQLPATHVVAAGETLWSIAQLYFNDPLLWPEIYRLNTVVIDDPHWIYPGEELNLAAAGGVAQAPDTTAVAVAPQNAGDTVRAQPLPPADTVKAAAPVAVTPPPETTTVVLDTTQAVEAVPPPPPEPSLTYLTVFERRRTAGQEVRDVLKAYSNRPYRPLRRGEFYAAGFLTEEEKHVGDSLLVVRIDRDIANWGKVVVPTGVARVTEVQRHQVLADVIMQFYPVRDDQLVLPLEPFKDPGQVRPTPVEEGLEGTVIAARDIHVLPGPQQIVFINRGRAEGVSPGDVFEVFKPATGVPGTSSEQVQMTLEIVHTRDHSSSGLVLNIDRPHLVPGMPVRLIRKMPS